MKLNELFVDWRRELSLAEATIIEKKQVKIMRIAIFLLCAVAAHANVAMTQSHVKRGNTVVKRVAADLTSVSSNVIVTAAKKVVVPPPPKQDTLKLVGLFALW